jgi:hypothetical protein
LLAQNAQQKDAPQDTPSAWTRNGESKNGLALMNDRIGARSVAGRMTALSPKVNVREHWNATCAAR